MCDVKNKQNRNKNRGITKNNIKRDTFKVLINILIPEIIDSIRR
jgi:hypothetical protein